MNPLATYSPTPQRPRSFWQRPEGTTGMVVASLFGAGAIWVGMHLLPKLITLLENLLYLSVLGAGLAGVLWLLCDNRLRQLFGYFYRSTMRFITGLFVQIDPIGILRNYVSDLQRNLAAMERQLALLRGQMRQVQDNIQRNQKQLQQAMQLAQRARADGNNNIMVLQSRQVGRLEASNQTLAALHGRLEPLYQTLNKMYQASEMLIADLESEIDLKSRERAVILASHSAFRQAVRILRGDPDQKALFDQTMDYLTEDYGNKLGEIEHFVSTSGHVLDNLDAANGVYQDQALALLQRWSAPSALQR